MELANWVMNIDHVLNSDEDEDIVELLNYERRPYNVRPRRYHFNSWDDVDFYARFRLKKQTVMSILELIEDHLEFPTDRNHSMRPVDQLLLALRFYASGQLLICCGDFFNVSKSTASKVIKRVSTALATLTPHYIKMPGDDEVESVQRQFFERARMPRVIGSIDCTHIPLLSPGGQHSELFRNRKGYFSLNVQTVSCPNLKILDIVARWPGSAHDQHIFNNSRLKQRFEQGEFGNALLVGDSGYANTKYLITPLLNTNNEVEELYNEAIVRIRNPVERQYGVWKRRFAILAMKLRLKLETAMAVIVATAVLHNIAVGAREDLPPNDPEVNYENLNFDEDWDIEPANAEEFINARGQLLANYFPHLLNM